MNSDVVKVTNKQGFFGKLGNSFSGIVVGIILLFGGISLLWWNEHNNVKNIKDVKEMRNQVIDVSSSKIDEANEGKLIATNGKLNYNDSVMTDSTFNISAKTPVLSRTVEMYQWVEESKTEDDTTTYTYKKEWKDEIVDSTEFNSIKGHENPAYMAYESDKFVTDEDLKVGEFTLISSFKDLLSTDKNVVPEEGIVLPEGYILFNKYITNSADMENPQVGDIRISYQKADYKDVSVLGKQVGDTIAEYTTKKNTNIKKIVKGTTNGTGMINEIESANKFMKWIYRFLGIFLIVIGISSILGPITTLIGYIPFVGKVVNSMIGVISFLVGLAISLVVIAISWFAARPIVAIVSLVIAAALIFVFVKYVKKNKGKVEVKETKKEETK